MVAILELQNTSFHAYLHPKLNSIQEGKLESDPKSPIFQHSLSFLKIGEPSHQLVHKYSFLHEAKFHLPYSVFKECYGWFSIISCAKCGVNFPKSILLLYFQMNFEVKSLNLLSQSSPNVFSVDHALRSHFCRFSHCYYGQLSQSKL